MTTQNHQNSETRYDESAAEFFTELEQAAHLRPDFQAVYSAYSQVLLRFLDQQTERFEANFGGPFAKMDYLLKEYQAPQSLARAVNDARVRIRLRHDVDPDELQRHCLSDLRALSQFVSLVCDSSIPAPLTALLPTDFAPREHRSLLSDRLRMIVSRWDDSYIYGQTDGSDYGSELRVACQRAEAGRDWTYLMPMLARGTQLNLVRPKVNDAGTIIAELIILEPDCLVSITDVARCFGSYADSPLVSIICQLQPQASSAAILLGNLMGQILDDELHHKPGTVSYAESVATFYRHNALSMLTTDTDEYQRANGISFHNEARRQQQHIDKALSETLPAMLGRFSRKEGIVEPSFFSELLGLQGRMDYLQADMRVLIEQKSGKGSFPYNNFHEPRHRQEHYVQLLLYMLILRYNFRPQYSRNHEELHAFLLYSKYDEPLLALGFAPELAHRAIAMRNGIAYWQLHLAQPGQWKELLATLTPDQLNEKHLRGRFWEDFVKPNLKATLDPIHDASPLEQAYFFRFLTFISNEHMRSKLGNKTKQGAGFASAWYDSLEEKRLSGNIVDGLRLVSPTPETVGNVETVELKADNGNDTSNFRRGDIVVLYSYTPDHEPDLRQKMVMRATISQLDGGHSIVLKLRNAQTDSSLFFLDGQLWAIEHDFMESSYGSLYRGMRAFLSAPKSRRELILLQREPRIDTTRQLRGSYGNFNSLSLHVKQALDLFLIVGPPGTGKTSFGLVNTLKEELLEPGSSVLLMAYTNRAVDEICSKLDAEGIDFIRIGGEMTCPEQSVPHLMSSRAATTANIEELRRMVKESRVMVGTTTAVNAHIDLFSLKHFSLAIIDEASQILEPHLAGIISAVHGSEPAISKLVMIGDHKQLPAVVQQSQRESAVNDPLLLSIGLTSCAQSLFERLLKRYHNRPEVVYTLTRQGRMHPEISDFTNQTFYGGRLEPVPVAHQKATLPTRGQGKDGLTDVLLTHRLAFFGSPLPQDAPSDKVNPVEAEMIAATVRRIYDIEREHFRADETIGIIVPYRNQISAIRNLLADNRQLSEIAIDTVERFQGSQRRYIIYGFTVQKLYQLKFLTSNVFRDIDDCVVDRKLNVAMTRAEEHLIMFGNVPLISADPIFSRLIGFMNSRQSLFNIPPSDFVSGHFRA